jgi:hypothetical protein
MRVLYLIPGWMSRTDGGRQEMARRTQFLRESAQPQTAVDVWDVEGGPSSIESMYEDGCGAQQARVSHASQDGCARGGAHVVTSCTGGTE